MRTIEAPALRFDGNDDEERSDFVSPLESALLNLSAEGGSDALSPASKLLHPDGSSEHEDDNDDVPTKQESQWLSLIRKASDSVAGSSPFRRKEEDFSPLQDSREGRLSRRSSFGSYTSARSIHSDADSMSHGEDHARTPSQSRRGRKADELGSSTHSDRRTSLIRRSSSKKLLRSSVKAPKAKRVLEKLETYDKDFDFDSTAAPWTKMILLEELGTASSWTILLLPYIAFIISVLLDTRSILLVSSIGPLDASLSCVNNATGAVDVPVLPTPSESCSYNFAMRTGHGVLASGKNSYLFRTLHYKELMGNGTAFESGLIDKVPPLSTFLYGDARFTNLSTDVVALVAEGKVMVSAVLLQRIPAPSDEWIPVSVAKPEPLSMFCTPDTLHNELPSSASLWNCSSPRVVNVLFPLPGTGVLSGNALRVNVLYSLHNITLYSSDDDTIDATESDISDSKRVGTPTFVFSEAAGVQTILSHNNVSQPEDLISDLVMSSSYIIEHESQTYETIKILVRVSTLLVSFLFTLIWCWSLGGKGFFVGGSCCCWDILCCLSNRSDVEKLPLTGARRESMFLENVVEDCAASITVFSGCFLVSFISRNRLDVVGIAVDSVSRTQILACTSILSNDDTKSTSCVCFLSS